MVIKFIMTESFIRKGPSVSVYSEKTIQSASRPKNMLINVDVIIINIKRNRKLRFIENYGTY